MVEVSLIFAQRQCQSPRRSCCSESWDWVLPSPQHAVRIFLLGRCRPALRRGTQCDVEQLDHHPDRHCRRQSHDRHRHGRHESHELLSGQAIVQSLTGGLRLLPALGHAPAGTNAFVFNVAPGRDYYWSVQAWTPASPVHPSPPNNLD